ncbi:hypothetical protein B0H16DRAFT_1737045 [Mycena metata]|uniref:Uncharacterized protein n=1 Tax=Mycena metata TaxID=1033252 RepID=A0AAD7HM71_9AGAR|nr:hypothetical protein B0H16DRAFT_1737045 [Mycena metata]
MSVVERTKGDKAMPPHSLILHWDTPTRQHGTARRDTAFARGPSQGEPGEAVTSTLILATVDFILVLRCVHLLPFDYFSHSLIDAARRVWILYDKKRWLLYLLVPMIALEIVTMALVSHYTIASVRECWALSWPLVGCYPRGPVGNVPRYFAFYSVPVLVVSMVMFRMTCYKCGKTLLTHGRAQMPIYNMFLRDGVFWFVAIFMTFIPEVVIWARARQSLAELLIACVLPKYELALAHIIVARLSPGLPVTSIIGSRVLMNIKALRPPKALPATTVTSETRLNMGTTIELDTIDYPSRIPLATVGTVREGMSTRFDP